jgi:hypothetical protein
VVSYVFLKMSNMHYIGKSQIQKTIANEGCIKFGQKLSRDDVYAKSSVICVVSHDQSATLQPTLDHHFAAYKVDGRTFFKTESVSFVHHWLLLYVQTRG